MVTIEKCNIDIMFINTRPVSAILCKRHATARDKTFEM